MATGCVKIVKRAKEFDPSTGKFIPEEKRAKSVDLFKGRRLSYLKLQMKDEGFEKSKVTCIQYMRACVFLGVWDYNSIHEIVICDASHQSQYQSRGKLFAGAKSGDIRVYQDKMINGSEKK